MKRSIVAVLAKLDEMLDEVLYRPAVVKAFRWLPRWWLCDLAKLSIYLDDRWATHYWTDVGRPGSACAACGRRAAWLEVGGPIPEDGDDEPDFLAHRSVRLCGWCRLRGSIESEEDLRVALTEAGAKSVAWRWRRP